MHLALIFNTNVNSVLLYGSEKRTETSTSIKSVQVCLKNIIGIRRPHTIRNVDLRRRAKQQPVEGTIGLRRWKLKGPTVRKANMNITTQALQLSLQIQRKRRTKEYLE